MNGSNRGSKSTTTPHALEHYAFLFLIGIRYILDSCTNDNHCEGLGIVILVQGNLIIMDIS